MAFGHSAVIGRDQHDGAVRDSGLFQSRQHLSHQDIRLRHRLVVLRRAVAVFVAGVIHVIAMDEGQGGLALLHKGDCHLHGLVRPVAVLQNIRGFAFQQAAEAFPIVKDPDRRGGLLRTEQAEDGREDAAIARADRADLGLVGLPLVRGNAMLRRPRAHNHGRPIGAAHGGNDTTRVQRVSTAPHQFMHHGRGRFLHPVRAHAVKAQNHYVVCGG